MLQHGTTFVAELNFNELFEYTEHRRLSVFCAKGTVCVCCSIEGTRFIVSVDNGGAVHYDVYTDDYSLMTVDHVIPLSGGGEDEIENKIPMCSDCNFIKGSRDITLDELRNFIKQKYLTLIK